MPHSLRPSRPPLAALGEVLAAVVLGALAWWCWHRGVVVTVQKGVRLSRIEGAWWAGATGVATLAGILLLDALRRLRRLTSDRP